MWPEKSYRELYSKGNDMSSAPTTSNEPIYSVLSEDPDLGQIVEMFVDEMPDRVANLLSRFESGDWEELRRATHQLKGAAGSYGFDAISPAAGEVEQAIHDGEPEENIRRTVDSLVDLCRRARSGMPS